MLVFSFVVGDVVMLVTGVTNGVMVVGDVVMLLTCVIGGAMINVPKLVNGGGAMVVL
jgi:hypothetical protein